jgi:peptide/nickel transport system substrate-binding protein
VALSRRAVVTAAASSMLARLAHAQQSGRRTLRYVPQGNLQNPDPIWTSSVIAKIHGYAIWDTLFGLDSALAPQPQMVERTELSDDQRTWRLVLRKGLRFHDGEPVRPEDCTASIARWAKRDGFGQQLLTQLDTMVPLDDRRFEIKLTRPFPMLPYALGSGVCFMMPERIAKTDPFQQIREFVGSGPYQFVPNEWVSGSQAVYTRFAGYVPRDERPDFTAGGKHAWFDRLEWIIEPDPATAAAALQTGEVDWVEQPLSDLLPMLRKSREVRIENIDPIGSLGVVRPNFLHPPFDNRAMRRALLPAIDQSEYMAAVMGAETNLARIGVGVFPAGTPLANDAGLSVLTKPRDLDLAKRLVAQAGYRDERVVLLSPSDFPAVQSIAQVTHAVLVHCGIDVDYVSADWGTVIARRNSREPVERGGWSLFCTYGEGLKLSTPAGNDPLRGDGAKAWYGWPNIPRLEELRSAWYDAPDLPAQRRTAEEIQRVALDEVAFYPIGQWVQPTAYRTDLTGVLKSPFPLFWNVRRT